MLQPFYNLLENELGYIFLQFPPFSNVIQQVSPCTDFHYKHDMLLHFKVLKQLNYIWMPELLQDLCLKQHLLLMVLISQILLTHRFYSHELLRQFVLSKIHFPKRPFAQDFTHPVKVNKGLRGLALLVKVGLDELDDRLVVKSACHDRGIPSASFLLLLIAGHMQMLSLVCPYPTRYRVILRVLH